MLDRIIKLRIENKVVSLTIHWYYNNLEFLMKYKLQENIKSRKSK